MNETAGCTCSQKINAPVKEVFAESAWVKLCSICESIGELIRPLIYMKRFLLLVFATLLFSQWATLPALAAPSDCRALSDLLVRSSPERFGALLPLGSLFRTDSGDNNLGRLFLLDALFGGSTTASTTAASTSAMQWNDIFGGISASSTIFERLGLLFVLDRLFDDFGNGILNDRGTDLGDIIILNQLFFGH